MERFFWAELEKNRPRYIMLDETQQLPFDPRVNKYLEAHARNWNYENNFKNSSGFNNTHDYGEGKRKRKDRGSGADYGEEARYNSGSVIGNGTHQGVTGNVDYDENSGLDAETSGGTSKSRSDGIQKSAQKAAPMSASNIGIVNGDGENTLAMAHLGELDFTYASQYGQSDAAELSNGSHSDERDGARIGADRKGGMGYDKASELKNEQTAGSEASKDARKNAFENSGRDSEARDFHNDTSNGNNESGYSNSRNINQNIYKGREGLTAQEALRTTEDYLRKYGPAIDHLIMILEKCFIGVYDI